MAIAVLVIVFIMSVMLLANEAVRSNIGVLGVLGLLVLCLVSLATTLATTEIIPPDGRMRQHLRDPRILGRIGSLLLVSFSSLYAYIPLFAEKGGVEATTTAIQQTLAKIGTDTAATRKTTEKLSQDLADKGIVAGKPTLVEQRIGGIWGQRDCANTYRFTLGPSGAPSRALTVETLRSAPGLDPYHGQFAYLTANDQFGGSGFARSILHTEEIKGNHEGTAVSFTLELSGKVEKLLWRSKSQAQNQLELVRCKQ